MRPKTYKSLPRPNGLFVVANIKARTAECRALLNPEPAIELTAEQKRLQKIADLCASKFDCHAAQTRELVQLIMGVTLPPAESDTGDAFPFVPGSLVVTNRITYLIERTDSDGDAVYYVFNPESKALERNSYVSRISRCVPATDEQIDAWAKRAGLTD